MALISSLYVKLSADSAQLTKELEKTKRQTKTWSQDVSSSAKYAAGAFAALGTAGALAAKTIWDSQAPVIDRLGKLSDQLEISVANLESYRFAADLAGVSNNALDQSLLKMNRRIGKAVLEGGAAVKAFKQLGLSAEDLSNKTSDEAFKDILGVLQEMESRSIANGIAFDIFGEKASDVMLITVDALEKGKSELGDFGALLSRVDARGVESANDAMYKLGVATNAISQNLAVNMAPLLQATAELWLENSKQAGGFREIGADAVGAVATVLGWMGDQIQNVEKGFAVLGYGATAAGLKIVEVLNTVGLASDETVGEWSGYMDSVFNDLSDLAAERNFSDVLSDKIAAVKAQTIALGEEVNRVGKGTALDITKGKSGSGESTDPRVGEARDWMDDLLDIYDQEEQANARRYAQIQAGYVFEKRQISDLQKFKEASFKSQTNTVLGELSSVTSGVAHSNKTMFKVNKAAGIANAIVNTHEGVSKSLAKYPMPIAGVMAAIHLASGMARVQAIKSASFDGGGGVGAVSTSGAANASSLDDTAGQTVAVERVEQSETTNNNSQNVVVIMSGGGDASQDDLDRAREQLRELTDTGALKLTGSSVDDMRLEVV